MTLQEMIARQRQLTETARQERRNLTAEEQAEFDNLQCQIDMKSGTSSEGENRCTSNREQRPVRAPEGSAGREEEAQRAALAERTRIREITGLCARFGMDAEPFISRGDTMAQVREAVLGQLERNGAPLSARVTEDEEDKKRAAIVDGILLRNNIAIENPAAGAGDFRGASLRMIAANCMAAEEGGDKRNYYMLSTAFIASCGICPLCC